MLAKRNQKKKLISQSKTRKVKCLPRMRGWRKRQRTTPNKKERKHAPCCGEASRRKRRTDRTELNRNCEERERETERHTHAHSLGCFLQKFKVTEMSIYTHKYTLTKNTNRILMEWEFNHPKKNINRHASTRVRSVRSGSSLGRSGVCASKRPIVCVCVCVCGEEGSKICGPIVRITFHCTSIAFFFRISLCCDRWQVVGFFDVFKMLCFSPVFFLWVYAREGTRGGKKSHNRLSGGCVEVLLFILSRNSHWENSEIFPNVTLF